MNKFLKAVLITFIILLIALLISILIKIIEHYCYWLLAILFVISIFAIFYIVCQELDFINKEKTNE